MVHYPNGMLTTTTTQHDDGTFGGSRRSGGGGGGGGGLLSWGRTIIINHQFRTAATTTTKTKQPPSDNIRPSQFDNCGNTTHQKKTYCFWSSAFFAFNALFSSRRRCICACVCCICACSDAPGLKGKKVAIPKQGRRDAREGLPAFARQ